MVEMALLAPILVLLLVGGAQVGAIAYGEVSIDTVAREAGRVAVLQPVASLSWYTGPAGTIGTYNCQKSDFGTGGNPACNAAESADGLLSSSLFTNNPCATTADACVTLAYIPSTTTLSSWIIRPPMARLAGCTNTKITGSVTGMPKGDTATISDSAGDTSVATNAADNFTMCVTATSTTPTEVFTALDPAGSLCGGYSGTTTATVYPTPPSSVTIAMTAEGSCTTPTTSSSSTTSATSSSSATSSTTSVTSATSSVVPPPAFVCPSHAAPWAYLDGFIKVTVVYPVPVFVPLVAGLFQSQPGLRQVTSTVTYAIEPCTLTDGA